MAAMTICNCRNPECPVCDGQCPEFVDRGKCDDCRRAQEKTRKREPVTQKWRRFSRTYLAKNPFCVECRDVATQVDHIDGSGRNGPNAFAEWNLAALCQSCHSRKTATQDGGFGNWG